jgi:DnaJ like chaperone protein
MFWPVTLLGAAAGMALANIPGALLGALLGQVLDRRLGLHSWAGLRARLSGMPLPADDDLLFILLGRLAKSEGRVLEAHIQQARAEMRELRLDEVAQRRAIDAFSRGKEGRDGLRGLLRMQRGRRGGAQALVRACWRMAWADGRVGEQERQLIRQWGDWLGLDEAEVRSLGEEYAPRKGPPVRSASGAYQDALRLLGVRSDSEPAAIKRAYRRLLSQHHPDKLAGAGASPVRVREATDKTRELQNAYRLIRERHGFR